MKRSRADTAAEEGFFPWPREVPAEWILRAHPIILMISALVLYHQFAPLPSSPMGYVSEFFILSTAFSMLSTRSRKKTQKANGTGGHQSGPERPAQ